MSTGVQVNTATFGLLDHQPRPQGLLVFRRRIGKREDPGTRLLDRKTAPSSLRPQTSLFLCAKDGGTVKVGEMSLHLSFNSSPFP